jgi:hypothetical protein
MWRAWISQRTRGDALCEGAALEFETVGIKAPRAGERRSAERIDVSTIRTTDAELRSPICDGALTDRQR